MNSVCKERSLRLPLCQPGGRRASAAGEGSPCRFPRWGSGGKGRAGRPPPDTAALSCALIFAYKALPLTKLFPSPEKSCFLRQAGCMAWTTWASARGSRVLPQLSARWTCAPSLVLGSRCELAFVFSSCPLPQSPTHSPLRPEDIQVSFLSSGHRAHLVTLRGDAQSHNGQLAKEVREAASCFAGVPDTPGQGRAPPHQGN